MFWARFCRQTRNAFIGVCLIGGHGCSTVPDGCTEMLGLLSRQLANVHQKRKIFPFSIGNAVVQKKRLYTATLARLPKKMEPSISRRSGRRVKGSVHCTRNVTIIVEIVRENISKKYLPLSEIYENYLEML